VSEIDQVRAQALEVAGGWSPDDAPPSWQLTAALFRVIAGHDDLLAALAELPPERLPALLASAAITFLVRRDRPAPLARYFPRPGRPQPAFDSGFHALATAFVSERLADIMTVCRERRYQMNEVARCTQVAIGIAATAGPRPGPVALIDLGTGAGLGLQLDRYRYVAGRNQYGPRAAGPSLSCEPQGTIEPPPADLPPIGSRVGIELNPIDLRDGAARAWLEACAPPEASALTRLTAANEVARRHRAPIVAGDAVDELPRVLNGMPAGQPAVVVDAYMAVFLPPERRALLAEAIAAAARSRSVTWLSLGPLVPLGPGGRDSVQGLALPDSLVDDYHRQGVFAVLGAVAFRGSSPESRLLARAHPSGQWIEWLAQPSGRPPAGLANAPSASEPGSALAVTRRPRPTPSCGGSGARAGPTAGTGR
jgi:hypothetical protein